MKAIAAIAIACGPKSAHAGNAAIYSSGDRLMVLFTSWCEDQNDINPLDKRIVWGLKGTIEKLRPNSSAVKVQKLDGSTCSIFPGDIREIGECGEELWIAVEIHPVHNDIYRRFTPGC